MLLIAGHVYALKYTPAGWSYIYASREREHISASQTANGRHHTHVLLMLL